MPTISTPIDTLRQTLQGKLEMLEFLHNQSSWRMGPSYRAQIEETRLELLAIERMQQEQTS